MKHGWKRAAVLVCLLALVLLLPGCGGLMESADREKVRLMVWSPTEDQSEDSGQWLQTCCERFAQLHPEWDITFVYGIADEPGAAGAVSQDPDASADVFMFANDTLTTMTDAKALAKFGGKYADEIRRTNSETLLTSVTLDGDIYGVPFTSNTWYMYYDKSVFSEEDVRSLEAMLEKGVVSFPMTNSWYLPAFYFGNGCTLFGEYGTDEEQGAQFGGEAGTEVTEYLIGLAQNPNFRIDADGSGIAGMRDGSISAMFTGSWDAAAIQEILGDNMTIPTEGWSSDPAGAGDEEAGGGDFNSDYPQQLDIEIATITARMTPILTIHPESLPDADGICPTCQTLDGKLRLFAKAAPKAELQATLSLVGGSGRIEFVTE